MSSSNQRPANRGFRSVLRCAISHYRQSPLAVYTRTDFSNLLRELGISAVPHGFRSSFRDWAAESTDAPHAVMEAALSHAVRNQVEAAYASSDLFERRRTLMEEWSRYLAHETPHASKTKSGDVLATAATT